MTTDPDKIHKITVLKAEHKQRWNALRHNLDKALQVFDIQLFVTGALLSIITLLIGQANQSDLILIFPAIGVVAMAWGIVLVRMLVKQRRSYVELMILVNYTRWKLDMTASEDRSLSAVTEYYKIGPTIYCRNSIWISRVDLVTTMTFIVLFLSSFFTLSNPLVLFRNSWAVLLSLLVTMTAVLVFRMTFLYVANPIIEKHYRDFIGSSDGPLFEEWTRTVDQSFEDMKRREHEDMASTGKRLRIISLLLFLFSLVLMVLSIWAPALVLISVASPVYYQIAFFMIGFTILFFILIFIAGDLIPSESSNQEDTTLS